MELWIVVLIGDRSLFNRADIATILSNWYSTGISAFCSGVHSITAGQRKEVGGMARNGGVSKNNVIHTHTTPSNINFDFATRV